MKKSQIKLGVNMEFVRHHDKSFAWGVEKAKEIDYTLMKYTLTEEAMVAERHGMSKSNMNRV